jgi:hypothetical protein
MANILRVIEPYWYQNAFVFDDEAMGLEKEPFLLSIPGIIDYLIKDIPDARSGFRLLFSPQPFSGYQAELTRIKEEYDGYGYKVKDEGELGWCCTVLVRYFEAAPDLLYIKAEPGRDRYRASEVGALQYRILKLEQMVGKLTLENDLLKRGKQT